MCNIIILLILIFYLSEMLTPPSSLFRLPEYPSQAFKKNRFKRIIFKVLYSKNKRQEMDNATNFLFATHTAQCWEYLIDCYEKNGKPPLHTFIKPKKEFQYEKIIWQYWAQGYDDSSLPNVVKLSLKSINRYHSDYKIIRLCDKTIHDYLEFPNFISEKRESHYQIAFFSDLFRLALLYYYGGIWMDATIFLTDRIPNRILNNNLFMFQRDHNSQYRSIWENGDNSYFGWHPLHQVNILNSFIIAKKHNSEIKESLDLLMYYWQTQDKGHYYFFFQVLFNVMILKKGRMPFISKISDDTLPHLLQRELNQDYDEQTFNQFTQISSIHKLTYQKKRKPNSNFDYLLRMYNL